jgi:hypothetical protein
VPSAFAAVAGEGEAAGEAAGEADGPGDAEAVAVLAFVAVFVGALMVQPARHASRARERDRAGREIIFILSALLRLILHFFFTFSATQSYPARGPEAGPR